VEVQLGWWTKVKTTDKDREEAARWLPRLWCLNPECEEFELPDRGKVRFLRRYGANETQLLFGCRECEKTFSLRNGTPLYGLQMKDEKFFGIVSCSGEGNGIRNTARIVKVKNETVGRVVKRVGEHVSKLLKEDLRNMWPGEVQLDELWSYVGKKQRKRMKPEELRKEFGDCWIWVAFDPETKVVLGYVLGKRTRENALKLLERVRDVLADGSLPLFASDGFPVYEDVIVEVFGVMKRPRRNGRVGRFPKPRRVPGPGLTYVVVDKIRKKSRVIRVERRVAIGKKSDVEEALAESEVSGKINTAFIERQNGKLRADNSRLARRTLGFSKDKKMLKHSLDLTIAYEMYCRPHGSLRQRDWGCTTRKWKPRTPMMAASITDHVWSVRELVLSRVPDRSTRTPFGGM